MRSEEFPPAWMNLGIVQAAQGRYDDALQSYQRALHYRPNYATCIYNIGNLYLAVGNEPKALLHWNEAVRIRPQLITAWSNILAAHDNAGRTAEVLRISEIAVRWAQSIGDAEATLGILFIRANAFGKRGAFGQAEALYHTVLAQRPAHALYWVNLGVLYHRWGGAEHEDKAMAAYEQALARDPRSQNARVNLAKLRMQIEQRMRSQLDAAGEAAAAAAAGAVAGTAREQ